MLLVHGDVQSLRPSHTTETKRKRHRIVVRLHRRLSRAPFRRKAWRLRCLRERDALDSGVHWPALPTGKSGTGKIENRGRKIENRENRGKIGGKIGDSTKFHHFLIAGCNAIKHLRKQVS